MTYSSKDKWIDRDLSEAYWFQEGPGVRNWQFTSSGIKLLNVANITKFGTIDLDKTERCLSEEEVEKKYKHFLVDVGDLVIASSGISFDSDGLLRTRGAFVQKEHLPLCMNTSTIRFKAKEGISDLNFLKFWLDSYEFREQITRLVTGSAQQNFGPSHLKSIQIKLPPLPEQRWIVAIAQKADRLRRTRRYALQLGDTYLQSVFLEMFGDPVTNPKGWIVKSLRSIAEKFSDGPFGSNLKTEHYTKSGVRVIRLQNVGVGELIDNDKAYVSEAHFASLSKHRCLPGDVIVGTLGDPNLRACILPDSIPLALNKADCIQIRCNSEKAIAEYICWLLNLPHTLHMTIGMIHGQTRDRINMGRLAELEVPIPLLPLQEKFAQIVQKFKRLRSQQREGDRQAEHLFQTLLHRAFRGELTPQDANDEPASVLLEQIGAEQAKAEAEAKAAIQAMSDAAEYLGTKAKQQDTEPIQLTLPGIE